MTIKSPAISRAVRESVFTLLPTVIGLLILISLVIIG